MPVKLDPFDGAKARLSGRVIKRRSGSTLSKPRHLCRGAEGLTISVLMIKSLHITEATYPLSWSRESYSDATRSQTADIVVKGKGDANENGTCCPECV